MVCLKRALIVSFVVGGCAAANPMTDQRRALHLESFDQVWTSVRDTHWDPQLGGLDWNKVREELRPQIAKAETDAEARAVIEEMLSRLGQSHFAVLPAEVYDDLDEGSGGSDATSSASDQPVETGGGTSGVDLRFVDGHAVITSVRSASPAAAALIRPGWIITAIDGTTVEEIIGSTPGHARAEQEILAVATLRRRLQGDVGKKVSIDLADDHDEKREIELALDDAGERAVRFGYLPAIPVRFESRTLVDGVGYLSLSSFLDPGRVMPNLEQAMSGFIDEKAPGVVIDLRGNFGGIGVMAMGIAGWFVNKPGLRLGAMHTRDGEIKFVVFPRARTYDGPLAVLIDGLSASTTEIFAGGLQDLGRARIFGQRSAGMALPSRVDRLPNGDGFQHAFADYVSTGGQALEGRGVIPDLEVQPTRAQILAGSDPVLEAALQWIASNADDNQS
jgi:carboxyl-terminal processing protease